MPPAAPATHAELAQLIARGDRRRAASLLVRDHAPAVLALCRAMVRDPRLAEDLSQDAFARAFGALEGFRGEASPRTWLLRIARNRCFDHLDHARRAPWATGGDPDPNPDDHAADALPPYDLLARREDASRAMAVLGEHERALVVLHFGHGVGYPELADAFGLREGAVRMRISRALARMRAALASDRLAEAPDFELESPTLPRPDRAEGTGRTEVSEGAAWRGSSSVSAHTFTERAAEDDLEIGTGAAAPAALDPDAWDTALAESPPLPTSTGELDELAQTTVRGLFGADFDDTVVASVAPDGPGPGAAGLASSPATFSSLYDEVPPVLRERLDALASRL